MKHNIRFFGTVDTGIGRADMVTCRDNWSRKEYAPCDATQNDRHPLLPLATQRKYPASSKENVLRAKNIRNTISQTNGMALEG